MITKHIAAATLLAALATPALAEGDPEAGEKVFRKCKACHQVGEGAKNRVGPALNGIVGAKVGQAEDFRYSKAFEEKAAEGMVWDDEALAAYLANPRDYIPGNKMSFAGLRKDDDIADVIAYLGTFE
ncbi:cytochrome c family protein [Roseovarius sp. A21]|uniref:Cytochrome c family protein n=1 Tax=Roseovarius bejariae TaxID=2576383 RepID=A0A844D1P5_9RHOB|nr:cytochrome c family protein [Roseovarius bejariae]MRU15773.1 cytochrome c family protein [Roseovarius bejariae]